MDAAAAAAATFSSRSSTCSPPAAVSYSKQHGAVTPGSLYYLTSRCRQFTILFSLILAILLFPRSTLATTRDVDLVNHFQQNMEPLLYDRTSPPPIPAEQHLHARQNTDSTTIATATPPTTVSLPRPFDTSIGNNFTTTTCPAFFNSFLFDPKFRDCLPISLLLQTSNAFFQASRSGPQRLNTILDASCKVDYPTCSTLLSHLASQITLPTNCGEDYSLQNPTVVQAYTGLSAYDALYHAACLQCTGPSSSPRNYCFTDAITNTSSPTSSYVYYLPLGLPLPPDARPSCNRCLQETMDVLTSSPVPPTGGRGGAAGVKGLYADAAGVIDRGCGAGFVRGVVASNHALPSSFSLGGSGWLVGVMGLLWVVRWGLF